MPLLINIQKSMARLSAMLPAILRTIWQLIFSPLEELFVVNYLLEVDSRSLTCV